MQERKRLLTFIVVGGGPTGIKAMLSVYVPTALITLVLSQVPILSSPAVDLS